MSEEDKYNIWYVATYMDFINVLAREIKKLKVEKVK